MTFLALAIVAIFTYLVVSAPKTGEAMHEAAKARARNDEPAAADYDLVSSLGFIGLIVVVLLLAIAAPLFR